MFPGSGLFKTLKLSREQGSAELPATGCCDGTWPGCLSKVEGDSSPAGNVKKNNLPSAEPSISREKAKDQGQNGRKLQTTPEFQAHVAKKLGAILDSSIAIFEHTSEPAQNSLRVSEVEDDGDTGFRLFSSSIPGDCGKLESVPLGRGRRLQCSSSSEQDSDQEWQRCREAAVSAADILQLSGLPAALQNPSTDHSCQTTEPSRKKKKKRKKAAVAKAGGKDSSEEDAVEILQNAQIGNGTERPLCLGGPCRKEGSVGGEDHDELAGKVVMKKKKKKKTEVRTD
ncbi:protein CUSTOS isoform X3 [Tiliqua scincoides]|uniref:protein CUSTOS isoform X3 n=1 Tax=Tiliqua scincoides TaxID=71010 RepID=UPI0034633B2B